MAKGHVFLGFSHLVIRIADLKPSALCRKAERSDHADHAGTYVLKTGNDYIAGENHLGNIFETGTGNGNRLSCNDLGGVEYLDAQTEVGSLDFLLLDASGKRPHKGYGQEYSEIFKYLLHICNSYKLEYYHPGF